MEFYEADLQSVAAHEDKGILNDAPLALLLIIVRRQRRLGGEGCYMSYTRPFLNIQNI